MRVLSKSRRWIAIVAGVCLLVVVGVVMTFNWWEARRAQEIAERRARYEAHIQRQLQQYPLVSVATRLEYETARQDLADAAEQSTPPVLRSAVAEDNLRDLERREHLDRRIQRDTHLRDLHEGTYKKFVESPGNGFSRMPVSEIRTPGKMQPEVPPIPLAPRDYDPDRPLPEHVADLSEEYFQRPDEAVQSRLHQEGVRQFLDRNWMGYVRDRDHVAGFVSHGFYQPKWFAPTLFTSQSWEIVQLELVSLLKHKTPVAYVSRHLPRMDELAKAETRPLDVFEQTALGQLRTKEDLVTDEGDNHIRMLGAIRAGTSCLECHSVQRGELLGAFSYELRRPRRVGE